MKSLHKYLGYLMLLPFIAWAVTGVFFFYKPGYKEAYQPLSIKFYPMTMITTLPVDQGWLEVRQLKTVLGHHLIVKDEQGWAHRSLEDFSMLAAPETTDVKRLVEDAIASNRARYGKIKEVNEFKLVTDTDVRISLNWQNMTLRQQGKDTDFINTIYNIHYLRWTGIKWLDEIFGVVGLGLTVLLAGIGVMLTVKRQHKR